jgi:hypothetical protein
VPRIPLFQPYLNVATQKNISGYVYWFHRQLDYRSLVKADAGRNRDGVAANAAHLVLNAASKILGQNYHGDDR